MRMRMRSWLLLLSSVAAAAQAAPPARLEIAYELLQEGKVLADIVDRLEHGGGAYRLTETWKGRGLLALRGEIRRSSRGSVVAGGLRPQEFADERTGREASRARFDWTAGTLTLQYQGPPQTVSLPADAQDRLSFLLAFAFAPPGREPVSFSIADGRGVSRQVYEVAGRERVVTPAGEFDALKLVRRKDGPDDRRGAEIWLAPARGYIPVRVLVIEKDGSRIDQVATRITTP